MLEHAQTGSNVAASLNLKRLVYVRLLAIVGELVMVAVAVLGLDMQLRLLLLLLGVGVVCAGVSVCLVAGLLW